ncbi:hypothetical protein HGO21_16155 [Acinetobacter sp. CUI P1]|nr:hypothetical protein [Acinetobacter sp. CUI P1]
MLETYRKTRQFGSSSVASFGNVDNKSSVITGQHNYPEKLGIPSMDEQQARFEGMFRRQPDDKPREQVSNKAVQPLSNQDERPKVVSLKNRDNLDRLDIANNKPSEKTRTNHSLSIPHVIQKPKAELDRHEIMLHHEFIKLREGENDLKIQFDLLSFHDQEDGDNERHKIVITILTFNKESSKRTGILKHYIGMCEFGAIMDMVSREQFSGETFYGGGFINGECISRITEFNVMRDGKLGIRLKQGPGIRTREGGVRPNPDRKGDCITLQVMLGGFVLKKMIFKLKTIVQNQMLLDLKRSHEESMSRTSTDRSNHLLSCRS